MASFLDRVLDLGKAGVDAALQLYKHLDSTAWWLVPGAAALTAYGYMRTATPKAVADNADKYVLNEALKASLAESIRREELLAKEKEAAKEYSDVKKYDRFLG